VLTFQTLDYNDLKELRRIHDRDYPHLEFPNFQKMLAFKIMDTKEGFILAGGVEMIGEALLITDKTKNRIKIGRALVEAQRVCLKFCRDLGIRELVAFTSDEEYQKHLRMHGFENRSQALSIMVPNGQR